MVGVEPGVVRADVDDPADGPADASRSACDNAFQAVTLSSQALSFAAYTFGCLHAAGEPVVIVGPLISCSRCAQRPTAGSADLNSQSALPTPCRNRHS